jgi:beta-N-acetylglucosaminidase
MGDSVDEGIINGAKWIKSNFYDNGYTTLNEMRDAGYASGESWSKDIQNIANDGLDIL